MRQLLITTVAVTFIAGCTLTYLIFQQANVKKSSASYATPYDGSTVPFTDLSGSAQLNASNFWRSHKASYSCPDHLLTRVGREQGDGGKWMCGLETLARHSVDDDYPCTIYSFGVNGDSAFEAEVLQRSLCSVYAYDPTVNKIGLPLKPSDPRVHYHRMGISGENSDSETLPRRTLKALMDGNGHEFIDILKVDVEGSEYDSMERMFRDFDHLPFGQLMMEVHNTKWTPERVQRILNLVMNLEKRGARVFSVEPNAMAINCCSEFSFINLNYRKLWIPDGQ